MEFVQKQRANSNKSKKKKQNSLGENDGDGVELVWELGFSREDEREYQMKGGTLEARVTNLTAALALYRIFHFIPWLGFNFTFYFVLFYS
jgi:hypothetical protein